MLVRSLANAGCTCSTWPAWVTFWPPAPYWWTIHPGHIDFWSRATPRPIRTPASLSSCSPRSSSATPSPSPTPGRPLRSCRAHRRVPCHQPLHFFLGGVGTGLSGGDCLAVRGRVGRLPPGPVPGHDPLRFAGLGLQIHPSPSKAGGRLPHERAISSLSGARFADAPVLLV